MSSLYWYLNLALIGVGTAVFTICKKKQSVAVSTFIIFYIFAACITWIGEFVALGLFNGYAYKPGIFLDPWAENIVAHLILNSTLWPGAATLVAAYSLNYLWMSFITILFLLFEYLFQALGIYEQHWWKYYMSAIVVISFLVISKKWYVKMNQKRHGLIRSLTFFFVAFVIIHLPIPLLLIFGKQYYNVGWVPNIYLSSTMFIFVYQLIESFFLILFVCVFKKWFWKLVPYAIAFIGQGTLAYMHILIFHDGWNLFYTLLTYTLTLTIFIFCERYTLKPKRNW